MSSHHIVREKQEPALLIINSNGFENENLGQLLEWSPTVLVAEQAYSFVDGLGVKIDGIITANPNILTQQNTFIIPTASSALEDGLKYLVGEQYPSVNIIDEAFALKDYALFADLIDLVIYTADKKIFPVQSGFSKWKPVGEQIILLHEAIYLKVAGLSFLTEQVLETTSDGFYSLTFEQPYIFIAESI